MSTARIMSGASGSWDVASQRAAVELQTFIDWLNVNGVRGLISEIGWPQNQEPHHWNRLISRLYTVCDKYQLPVLAFTAQGSQGASGGPANGPGTMYTRSTGTPATTSIDTFKVSAPVAEAHPPTTAYWRGIDVFGGAANDGGGDGDAAIMSNASPGTFGTAWWYEPQGTYTFLANRGYNVARIGFRWERLQPTRGAALNASELARIQQAVTFAGNAGMKAVLDLHNYGMYVTSAGPQILGSPGLPLTDLIDVWQRLSDAFVGNTNVLAYSLMNEPHGMPFGPFNESPAQLWEKASQAVLSAIRTKGDTTEIHVSVYEFAHITAVTQNHLAPWITDPANNMRYEAHIYPYYDHFTAGRPNYPDTYDTELTHWSHLWSRWMQGHRTWATVANNHWSDL
jgi:aryl-phospho-beta-D-glucosidase BglC (GH1 family)